MGPRKISGTAHIAYFAWPHMSAICTMPATMNAAVFRPEDLVPLTSTLCPTYLAKTCLLYTSRCV